MVTPAESNRNLYGIVPFFAWAVMIPFPGQLAGVATAVIDNWPIQILPKQKVKAIKNNAWIPIFIK